MKKQTTRKVQLVIVGILFGLSGMFRSPIYAAAAEKETAVQAESEVKESESGQLMVADEDVDMKTEPSDSAETIVSHRKGDFVFVTGEAADGWYHAIYQGKEGYVPQDSLSVSEIDVAGLDEEMARTQQEAKLVVETVEHYRAQARRSKIWGSVIVVLVLGIFATGIISSRKGVEGKEKQGE